MIDGDPLTYDQTRQFPSISILHISEQDGWPKLPIGSNGRVAHPLSRFGFCFSLALSTQIGGPSFAFFAKGGFEALSRFLFALLPLCGMPGAPGFALSIPHETSGCPVLCGAKGGIRRFVLILDLIHLPVTPCLAQTNVARTKTEADSRSALT